MARKAKRKTCLNCAYFRAHLNDMMRGECFGVEVRSTDRCHNHMQK